MCSSDLPGTGGLTRVTDKRKVRHDLADIFCTTNEGVRGQKAKDLPVNRGRFNFDEVRYDYFRDDHFLYEGLTRNDMLDIYHEIATDGVTVEYFTRYFGEPLNGQGDFQGRLSEHLFLNNSDNVRAFLRRKKGNFADALLTALDGEVGREPGPGHPHAAQLERFVLAC